MKIYKKSKLSIICFLVGMTLFLGIVFSSCASTSTVFDIENLYSDTIKETVEIRCYDTEYNNIGYATGCVISKDGQILTNKHVIMSNDNIFQHIEVRFYDNNNFMPASILKVSETEDLALIKIEQGTKDVFTIGQSIKGGERVFTIGNPNGFGLSFAEGTVSSPLRYVRYNGKEIKTTQTSIIINEGNSGGPLFNADGELIGLITFRLRNGSGEIIQGVSFALHYSVLKDFLE